MYRSRAPYRCGLFKMIYSYCEAGFGYTQGYKSGYDHVFRSVKGLHCTWLVPRTRVSFDDVDVLDSGEWIHLKRGIDRGGYGPIGLRGHHIMLSGGLCSCVLIRLDFQTALETLISFFRCIFCVYTFGIAPGLGSRYFGTYSLLPRGTQIPYSTAVDLVAGLGLS
ncbi:hypothetical protein M9H77_18068 [Catharanthus roseus]|uniref:Uncharacterized protein n=1 Tax=Catharanthus roseus TaxID=4058 RepID=A0ACC0B6E8_CATRO|nr:hypothetical protein M9H77_18068 [Catharanthus roseus]